MWQCNQCKYENQDSNRKCHGAGCKVERPYQATEKPVKRTKIVGSIKKEFAHKMRMLGR
jgi:hypothetical protein